MLFCLIKPVLRPSGMGTGIGIGSTIGTGISPLVIAVG